MLSEGASRMRICQTISEEAGVTWRQVDHYITAAREQLVLTFKEKRENYVAAELAKLDHLFDRAVQTNQLSAAAGAAALKLRVIGADSPKN